MQYKRIIVRIILIACLIAGSMDLMLMKPASALWSMVGLYFCIPLASLALTSKSKHMMVVWGGIATVLILLISRFSVYTLLAVGVFIGGTIYSILQHHTNLHRRKHITTWAIATVHSSIFALVCAVAGSFSILGKGGVFNETCDDVRTVMNDNMATILTPLRFTEDQIAFITAWVDKFFTKSPEDLVNAQISNQLGDALGGPSKEDLESMVQNAKNPIARKMAQETLNRYETIQSQLMGDRQQVNDKICEVVFTQIREWSMKPGFKISILITLILFFYPLIKLAALILAGIVTLLYLLLRKIGFISVVPEEKIVETWVIGDYEAQGILAGMSMRTTPRPDMALEAIKRDQAKHKELSPVQIAAQKAIPPKLSTPSKGGGSVEDIMGDLTDGGGTGVQEDHIVTANSPQDTDPTEPAQPKKEGSTGPDFGSFGGNFGKKFKS